MAKKICYTLLIFYLVICLIQCSKQKDTMEFRINHRLLGPEFSLNNFSFSPPSACKEMPDSFIEKATQLSTENSEENANFAMAPIRFFFNEADNFLCSVSEIKRFPANPEGILQYQKVIREKYKNFEIKESQFQYHGYKIYQFLIMSDSVVQFKLLLLPRQNRALQLDYVVPRENYVKYIEAIESSIGSIKKAN